MGSDSPQCGASLALSGMAGQNPCIPLSARESATGIQDLTTSTTSREFDQEDLILEDNGCPGVQGLFLHGPGRAEPFMVTRTGAKEAVVSPEQSPAVSRLAAKSTNLATAAATASILFAGPAKSDVNEHSKLEQRCSDAAMQRSSDAGSSGAAMQQGGDAVPCAPSSLLACATHACCLLSTSVVCTCACPACTLPASDAHSAAGDSRGSAADGNGLHYM